MKRRAIIHPILFVFFDWWAGIIPAFLDVLAVTMRNEIFPGTKSRVWPYAVDLQSIFADAGKYLLTVAVAGDGSATITAALEFNWTGDWQTCDLRLLRVN
jgi:hypothetical protein